jgi:transcriptional regulator with XRE-family HTH domain
MARDERATERLAKAIAAKRRELGLTQEGLAELMGVDHNTVSRWELGQRSALRHVDRLNGVLGITHDDLNGDDE